MPSKAPIQQYEIIVASRPLRVPTPTVGAINITLQLDKSTDTEEIVSICENYAKGQKYKVMLNNHEPLVSSDFQAKKYTTIVDHRFTSVTGGNLLNMLVWYDNEWEYASKMVNIVEVVLRQAQEQ